MDRYEDAFGTDWTGLEREDALTRAFALGVAAACGDEDEAELDRLVSAVDTAYDRSMVELAFHEGRQKGGSLRPELEDDAAVWETLVDDRPPQSTDADDDEDGDEAETGTEEGADGTRSGPRATDRPDALSRASLLDRVDPDDREALRFPPFLRRE
ncbi:hypothetical protein ACFO0N_02670 [Halobium salinum]|uniref:Uncharacterized protein n=1 Tax=Halobium salinum TaxID=1364940 RepID=A0ABD5P7X3_9EURY|nr:hypothetical protein [Halobium salinum]